MDGWIPDVIEHAAGDNIPVAEEPRLPLVFVRYALQDRQIHRVGSHQAWVFEVAGVERNALHLDFAPD